MTGKSIAFITDAFKNIYNLL